MLFYFVLGNKIRQNIFCQQKCHAVLLLSCAYVEHVILIFPRYYLVLIEKSRWNFFVGSAPQLRKPGVRQPKSFLSGQIDCMPKENIHNSW